MLESFEHEANINMVKNPDWRDADSVSLERLDGRIIIDGVTRVQAFEAGEVDALDGGGLPPEEIERLKAEPYFEQYPSLGTYYYGFNTKNISDLNERQRAVARDQPEDHHGRDRPDGPRPGHRHDPEGHARLRRHQPGVALASARG